MHPYFADLDRELVPAVREEYVGPPVDMFPPSFAERFDGLVRLVESDLGVDKGSEGNL